MLTRRQFLERTLKGSSLLAVGATVPCFVASTARAAEVGKDRILVVVEMGGGNDGLNTVIPYADDLYYKYRPTLGLRKQNLITVDDRIGLNSALRGLDGLLDDGQLAIVQGVGYPNPNRSHFESMDIWQTADPGRNISNGWLGRSMSLLDLKKRGVPAFHIGQGELPLALTGSGTGVPTLNTKKPFGLQLGDEFYGHRQADDSADGITSKLQAVTPPLGVQPSSQAVVAPRPDGARSRSPRQRVIHDLTRIAPKQPGSMLDFVRQTSLQTYATLDSLQEIMSEDFKLPEGEYGFDNGRYRRIRGGLAYELQLIARMIRAGFGTRVYYVSIGGFDTHSRQLDGHNNLLRTLGTAVGQFFRQLRSSGDDKRVVLTTFSEFGRRVRENGSRGTDHGSGSSLFVAGPSVKGGLLGEHPSLEANRLASGDLAYHTDFRRVYATLLDNWLGCDSRHVLGEKFEHVQLLKA